MLLQPFSHCRNCYLHKSFPEKTFVLCASSTKINVTCVFGTQPLDVSCEGRGLVIVGGSPTFEHCRRASHCGKSIALDESVNLISPAGLQATCKASGSASLQRRGRLCVSMIRKGERSCLVCVGGDRTSTEATAPQSTSEREGGSSVVGAGTAPRLPVM